MEEKEMLRIIKSNRADLSALCRLCLNTDKANNVNINTGNIRALLERCLGMSALGSPRADAICHPCLRTLTDLDIFRTNSERVNRILLSLTSSPPDDPEDGESSRDATDSPITIKKEESDPEDAEDPTVKEEEELVVPKSEDIAGERFPCEICGKTLKTATGLRYHRKLVHEEKLIANSGRRKLDADGKFRYKCGECEYSSPFSQSVRYHRRVHTGERPYECKLCGKAFTQTSSLKAHERRHENALVSCPTCGKQFKNRIACQIHVKRRHVDDKVFVCPLCDKGLKSKQTFRSHMDRHDNVKRYSCETCGDRFVTYLELKSHRQKHFREKNFQCDKCPFKTYTKRILDAHSIRHTGEKAFKCELCEYDCYTGAELRSHTRKHTKVKDYSCPICEGRFAHGNSVRKHIRNVHKVEYPKSTEIDRRIIK